MPANFRATATRARALDHGQSHARSTRPARTGFRSTYRTAASVCRRCMTNEANRSCRSPGLHMVKNMLSRAKAWHPAYLSPRRGPGTYFFSFRFRAFSASMRLKVSTTLGGQRNAGALAGS